jgi:hypothetical protein
VTFATLCDQCDRRIDYDDQWRVQIEMRPSANWLKRAIIWDSGLTKREELHFCSVECLARWAGRAEAPAETGASLPPTEADGG